jgi:phosphatidate phosphatase APP1
MQNLNPLQPTALPNSVPKQIQRSVEFAQTPGLRPPSQLFHQDQLQPLSVSLGNVPVASAAEYQTFSTHNGKKLEMPVYTTYGTPNEFTVRGRLLEAEASAPSADDNWFDNLRRTVHQLHAEDKQHLWVNVSVMGQSHRVQTDQEGFFELKLQARGPVKPGYYPVEAKLEPNQKQYYAEPSRGKVVIQNPAEISMGVVTDIDDTIQVSNVTQKSKMAETFLFKNPYSQKAVPGMAEFLSALDRHSDGEIDGDINYVSGSPINIAPRLETFLSLHGFPDGPLDLKYMGLGPNRDSPTEQFNYKLGKIRTIFETYPNRSFVLIGDSGEKDPEVYRQIALDFPGRVQAIYIHNVTDSNPQAERFQGMLAFDSADQAAADAVARGLISPGEQFQVNHAVAQAKINPTN